jgi:phosphopantothenoylcysteine decarboxylase/phosphopantothenate--cysteine ligase
MLAGKRILLIICGGIAAYKTLDLIRRLRADGASVSPVMTAAAAEFVTPLSVSALAGEAVHSTLFDLTAEAQMGHIQLSRIADLVVVAPATADMMAKMAGGHADDLASTLLMATDTPVLLAPAMNVRMWHHPATQRNLAQLQADGIALVGPDSGDMACGEYGPGRMAEPADIHAAIRRHLAAGPLAGRRIIVTSGPTQEPIDPVRYISNRSSGAQGTAIAQALQALGAHVVFVTGPADVAPPQGVELQQIETAQEMLQAVTAALPADAVVCAAAVADWRVANAPESKMKKQQGRLPVLEFAENPDILATISAPGPQRPALVVGFAAETDDVLANAQAKRARKGCDWIVANDVSPATGTFGGAENTVHLVSETGVEDWPKMAKTAVAQRLAQRIADRLTS